MKKENILVTVLILVAVAGVLAYHFSKAPEQGISTAGSLKSDPASKSGSGISWQGYEDGLAKAKVEDKNVFLYFHAQWCTYCTKLKKYTFTDKKVQAIMDQYFVSISVDTDQNQALATEWEVRGLPTMWFLKPDGSRISSLPGYVDADQMVRILDYIQSKSYDTMSFHEFVQKS